MFKELAVGLCVVGGCLCSTLGYSQTDIIGREYNPIKVGVAFLSITPDSRAAGYGDQGVASIADNNAQFWNPAKYPFHEAKGGASFTYTPWLKNLISGISLNYLAGFYKIDQVQAVSASLRYFALGKIEFKDESNMLQKQFSPNELAFDAAYSRMFSNEISSAIAFRYLRSDITGNSLETKTASSFAADIALYYQKELRRGYNKNEIALGASITNIGSKIAYSNDANNKAFIPTTLRIGGRYTAEADRKHLFSIMLEISKLLVPTPKYDENNQNLSANKSVIEGLFSSFGDAPNGFKEELQETMLSAGAEYTYNSAISLRAGLFNESKNKGNRKFFTFGGGIKYSAFILDFAYLVPTANGANNPLANTFRITIGTELGKDKYGRRSSSRRRFR